MHSNLDQHPSVIGLKLYYETHSMQEGKYLLKFGTREIRMNYRWFTESYKFLFNNVKALTFEFRLKMDDLLYNIWIFN